MKNTTDEAEELILDAHENKEISKGDNLVNNNMGVRAFSCL